MHERERACGRKRERAWVRVCEGAACAHLPRRRHPAALIQGCAPQGVRQTRVEMLNHLEKELGPQWYEIVDMGYGTVYKALIGGNVHDISIDTQDQIRHISCIYISRMYKGILRNRAGELNPANTSGT